MTVGSRRAAARRLLARPRRALGALLLGVLLLPMSGHALGLARGAAGTPAAQMFHAPYGRAGKWRPAAPKNAAGKLDHQIQASVGSGVTLALSADKRRLIVRFVPLPHSMATQPSTPDPPALFDSALKIAVIGRIALTPPATPAAKATETLYLTVSYFGPHPRQLVIVKLLPGQEIEVPLALLLRAKKRAARTPTSPPRKRVYPDVWLRRGATTVYYPSARAADRFHLPNGLPDVVLAPSAAMYHESSGVLETFFGGKKFQASSISVISATLADGSSVNLNLMPPTNKISSDLAPVPLRKGWKRAARVMMYYESNLPPRIFSAVKYPSGAMLGIENLWVRRRTRLGPEYGCEPVTTGLIWLNPHDKTERRKTLVSLDTAASATAPCNAAPQQRTLFGPSGLSPLPDGTVLVNVNNAQVRVDPASGAFHHLPQSFRVVDSKTLLAFKRALFTRLNNDRGWSSREYPLPGDRYYRTPYSLMTQYFIFPEQVVRALKETPHD